MYKILKLKGNENNIFVTSDAHINQECKNWENPLWEQRGFSSVEEHTRGFIDNWNKVCDDESIVFHLGDFIFQDPEGKIFWSVMRQLRFAVCHHLTGNHHSGTKNAYFDILYRDYPDLKGTDSEIYPLKNQAGFNTNKTIVFWPEYLDCIINKTMISFCHYPISSFNGQAAGSLALSGHSHGNNKMTNKDTGQGNRLDCDFGSFLRPISISEVKAILKNRELDLVDHHGN